MSKQIHKKTFVMFCMIIISLFWSKLQKGVYIILPFKIVDFFRYQAVFFYFNRRTCLSSKNRRKQLQFIYLIYLNYGFFYLPNSCLFGRILDKIKKNHYSE